MKFFLTGLGILLIAAVELPGLYRRKLWRELIVVTAILGFVLLGSALYLAGVRLPPVIPD